MRTRHVFRGPAHRFVAAVLAVLAVGLLAVAGLGAETNYPLEITDYRDRSVTIQAAPSRIISLAPSVTETVFALGRSDRLVGRTDYDTYPAEVMEIESVGTLQTPNIEKIVSLRPDLVIAATHFTQEALRALEQAGVNVAIIQGGGSFESVYESIRDIGLILNASRRAEGIVADMRQTVREVQRAVRGEPRPRVYYVIGFGESGDYTAGGTTFIGQLIEMAGGNNIASDLEGWSYSLEKIVAGDPEVILCSQYYGIPEQIRNAHGYQDLDAIENGNLVPIDNNKIDRPGPRLAEGLKELAAAIHPELF